MLKIGVRRLLISILLRAIRRAWNFSLQVLDLDLGWKSPGLLSNPMQPGDFPHLRPIVGKPLHAKASINTIV